MSCLPPVAKMDITFLPIFPLLCIFCIFMCQWDESYKTGVIKSVVTVYQQKLWELAKQVSEFLVWRQVICPFDRDRRVLQYLVTTPVFSEDGQFAVLSAF